MPLAVNCLSSKCQMPVKVAAQAAGLVASLEGRHGTFTYTMAHPEVSKQQRKILCRLIDSQKLSAEASIHAAQNERLPVRAVIQALFSEQTRLNRHIDWSGSFSGKRSPTTAGVEPSARCHSKREVTAQQMEIRKLKEDILRLQSQCTIMQAQIERLMEKKNGFFRWKKLGLIPSFKSVGVIEKIEGESEFGRQTPMDMKAKLVRGKTPPRWRKSQS